MTQLRYFGPNELFGPAESTTKYWSSNQALIFIGPYLLDEVVALTYTYNQSKIPIYGYNDQYYKVIAGGKSIGQGQLTLNYIDSNYLSYAMIYGGSRSAKTSYQEINEVRKLATANDKKFKGLLEDLAKNDLNKSGKSKTSDKLIKRIAEAFSQDPDGAKDAIQKLKRKFWGTKEQLATKTLKGLAYNNKNSYINIKKDIDEKGIAGWRPDLLPPISIVVSHGDPTTNQSIYRVLYDVEFTGLSSQINIGGSPQTETYPFIYRTLV